MVWGFCLRLRLERIKAKGYSSRSLLMKAQSSGYNVGLAQGWSEKGASFEMKVQGLFFSYGGLSCSKLGYGVRFLRTT